MSTGEPNGFTVAVEKTEAGWKVDIHDPSGERVSERFCSTEEEAATYASSVRQHIRWLSEPRFREYYRL